MLVKESISFERKRDPKKTLLGDWLPGDILINLYNNIVYLFISQENDNEVLCIPLGHLNTEDRITNKNPYGKNFFRVYKQKIRYMMPYRIEKLKLRPITYKQLEIIKPALIQYKELIEDGGYRINL